MTLADPDVACVPSTVLQRLRDETAEDHRRLETALDLLAEPLDVARFRRVIGRFWGFHRVWEPAIERALGERLGPRSRLGVLRDDLQALGVSAIERLPLCAPAAPLGRMGADHAFGSLYVLEGSTLGGKVIGRALADADWLPPGGLASFDPYGSACGLMWQGLRRRLAERSRPAADDAMTAGARATFHVLEAWLPS